MKTHQILALTALASVASTMAFAQVGVGVNSSVDAGASVGTGTANSAPATTGIKADIGGSVSDRNINTNTLGKQGTGQNTVNNTMETNGNVNTTNGMKTNGSAGTASTGGRAVLSEVLPSGSQKYTYYPSANVYFAPATNTYYYRENGMWYSGANAPTNVKLGKSRSVKVRGTATTDINGSETVK